MIWRDRENSRTYTRMKQSFILGYFVSKLYPRHDEDDYQHERKSEIFLSFLSLTERTDVS
jgi:hypothetical protein